MRKILLNSAIALGAIMALGAPQTSAQPAASHLRIGLAEDPDLLDPTLGSSFVGRVVYAAMCDKLFDLDDKLNIVPQLATGHRYESPTSLIITLRPGVTFHDGEKLTAEAAKYKLTRDLTLKGSMRAGEINAIQTIDVIDPLTIRLTLKQPASQLLAQLTDRAGIMISPKAAEAAGDKFGLAPVCAGGYAFDSRVPQDRIVLKRYPGHYNATHYHFDRVTYLPIPNSSVRLANLQAGTLDIAFVAPTDVAAVKKDPKLALTVWDALGYTGINFNLANGPAADTITGKHALVRQAFELTLDRQTISDVVFAGMLTPTAQANPPTSPFYIPAIQPPARDIARAKALLAQAGITGRIPVDLTVTNAPEAQQAAEVIQSMAAEAGFDVKPKVMEFASSLQAGYKGEFQAYMIGWSGRSDADGNMWPQMHSKGAFNYGKHLNPAMDALLDEARVVTAVADRRAIYAKVWETQRADLPLIYLYATKNIVGTQKTVQGLSLVPDGLLRLGGTKFGN